MRYVCSARLNGAPIVFLWEGGDTDRVVTDDAGLIVTFPDEITARPGTSPEATARYDFDAIDAWCNSCDPPDDCKTLYDAWNMLGDLLPHSEAFARANAAATAVHRKLFYGCNVPAMTPPGNRYVPQWDGAEVDALRAVLRLGLADFRRRLPLTS